MRAQTFSQYPRPLIINPQTPPHRQTIIILHDRGSNATDFGPALLFTPLNRSRHNGSSTRTSSIATDPRHHQLEFAPTSTLHTTFPHAKFIFPTASLLRAAAFTESVINQWFDTYWPLAISAGPQSTAQVPIKNGSRSRNNTNGRNSIDEETQKRRSDLLIPGLRDTVRYVHHLIRTEIDLLHGDAASIVLGGLGQGCAASIIAALLWEGDPLGAWFGLCGWLPFADQIRDAALPEAYALSYNHEGNDDDQCQDDNKHSSIPTPIQKGINFTRGKLNMPASLSSGESEEENTRSSFPSSSEEDKMPLFIAHGTEDKTVPINLSRQMVDCLATLGWKKDHHHLQYKECPGLGHCYSDSMLCGLVNFLEEVFAIL